jgi:hypothetical protein
MPTSVVFADVSVLFTKYVIESRETFRDGAIQVRAEREDLSDEARYDMAAAGFLSDGDGIRRVVDLDVSVTRAGTVTEGLVLVSVLPGIRVVSVGLGLRFSSITAEELFFLRRAITSGEVADDPRIVVTGIAPATGGSVLDRVMQEAVTRSDRNVPTEYSTVIELRPGLDGSSADQWVDHNLQPLYGILIGDEGWERVPIDVATARLAKRWTTRDFVTSVILDRNLLQVSDKPSEHYEKARTRFAEYGYEFPPHLDIGSAVPGLEFGGLFSMQWVMARSLTMKELEKAAAEFSFGIESSGIVGFLKSIFNSNAAAKSLHFQLADGLARIEESDWWEWSAFHRTLQDGLRLPERIERLKWWLGLADAGSQLRYQARMNNLVILLTFVIATLEIVIAILTR